MTATMTSEAALAFLGRLTPVEDLMPKLSYEQVAGKAATPIAEQLTSPGALRQQRYAFALIGSTVMATPPRLRAPSRRRSLRRHRPRYAVTRK